ncbi:hypothetical protein [Azospirillum sp. B510]|uniref:hypothetical protein n=1 Tax=Azospirillum sp. (strain B510) TaxID=137722 RepID=UPI0005A92FFA|nr:hypothetical protein [Azospirillum sp. B510]
MAAATTTPGGDSVKVSKLGQALTGMAAKAFEHLDKDSKTQLETLVETGRVSADDAVKGLRSLAKSALFNRFAGEAPATTEESAASARMKEFGDKRSAAMKAGLPKEVSDALGALDRLGEAMKNGSISQEQGTADMSELHKRLSSASRLMTRETLTGLTQEEDDEDHRLLNVVFGSKTKRFAEIDFGEGDNETGSTTYKIQSKDELDAEERLFAAGFKLESNAMARFAADFDIPGLGKGTMPAWKSLKPITVPT